MELSKGAVIYCRQSTDEQHSLPTQLEWCINYAEKNNIPIIATFGEPISAFIKDRRKVKKKRTEFDKMIEIFEKGKADILITYQIDRLARNPIDEGEIKQLAIERRIKKIYSEQGEFDGKQILTISLFFAMANQYSIDHSDRVERGIKRKVEGGDINRKAPPGYYNDWSANGNPKKDKDTIVYVEKMMKRRIEGKSVDRIRIDIFKEGYKTEAGKPIAKSVLERMFKNPFYYGFITFKGELFKGNHEPLISKKMYDKINSINRGIVYVFDKDITPLKGKVYYKGDIIDNETGKIIKNKLQKMTCSLLKKKFVYFHLHSRIKTPEKGKSWYNQDIIIDYFDKHIQYYCIPKQFMNTVKEGIKGEINVDLDILKDEEIRIKARVSKIDIDFARLKRMRMDEELTAEEFLEDKNKLVIEKEDLQDDLKKLIKKESQILDHLSNMVLLYVELKDKRFSLETDIKLQIINNIVVGLTFDKQKRLYIDEEPIFMSFRLANNLNWWDIRGSNPRPSP